MKQGQDQERAIRARDNKRRHRQRRREYIADIERRLVESREKGICATREVQAAAQQVSWENERLRQILLDQGLDNDAINALVYRDAGINSGSPSRSMRTPRRNAEQQDSVRSASTLNTECSTTRPSNAAHPSLNMYESSSLHTPHETKSSKNIPCLPPCKLLSILANNPSEDITQVPAGAHEQSDRENPDSMGCAQARELLMRFATTEDKLDSIALALETGCVQDEMGTGCRVKNDLLWKTLDHVLE